MGIGIQRWKRPWKNIGSLLMKSDSKHLDELIGKAGEFEHGSRHVMCQCVVRGVDRGHGPHDSPLLVVDYVSPDEEKIEGAFILPADFIPDGNQ